MNAVTAQIEPHRGELTGYCYRMLGSAADAQDAVQETMVRAWKKFDSFEGRSSLRTWLYRIATNVCLDMLRGAGRRALPMDLGPATTVAEATIEQRPENTWLTPVPDAHLDPAEAAVTKDSVRLAFVAALQHLPARQRAVLVLREVLEWPAADVAELLGTSVASVNSALQRARAAIDKADVASTERLDIGDAAQQELLSKYVSAFEQYDMDALAGLLRADATMCMPPISLWLRGAGEVVAWMIGPGNGCEGSRLIPTVANGMPAFGQYRPDPDGGWHPWGLQVLDVANGQITGLNVFLDTKTLFPLFDLPDHLEAGEPLSGVK